MQRGPPWGGPLAGYSGRRYFFLAVFLAAALGAAFLAAGFAGALFAGMVPFPHSRLWPGVLCCSLHGNWSHASDQYSSEPAIVRLRLASAYYRQTSGVVLPGRFQG
jgi:hypothetical protein